MPLSEDSPPSVSASYAFQGQPPVPQTAAQEGVLFGPLGLRAGWTATLFIFFNLLLAVGFDFGRVALAGKLHFIPMPHAASAAAQPLNDMMTTEIASAAAVLLATLLMAAIEQRRVRVYGLSVAKLADMLPGMAWGLAAMTLVIGVLRALHLLTFDAQLLHGKTALLYGTGWLLTCLFIGIFEESLTRGYLLYTLTRGAIRLDAEPRSRARAIAFWRSALLMSAFFGLSHLSNPHETALGIFQALLAGMVFCYALWRTGSLWWAVGFHMTWDWAQSFLYGVPDSGQLSVGRLFQTHPSGHPLLSGGIDGPEGSVLVVPVLLLVLAVIRLTTKPAPQPPLAAESMFEPGLSGIA